MEEVAEVADEAGQYSRYRQDRRRARCVKAAQGSEVLSERACFGTAEIDLANGRSVASPPQANREAS